MGHLKAALRQWAFALNGPFEKYIYPTAKIVKSLHNYVWSQWKRFWLWIYARCSSMRSKMLYTRGSFEICQEQLFVKQCRKHRWSSYLLVALTELRKNIIMHIVPRKTHKVLILHEVLFAQKNNANFYLHVAWAFSNCQLFDAEM